MPGHRTMKYDEMLDGNSPENESRPYILDVLEKLHRDKVTAHWIVVAMERIANGEPERQVMYDYGYEYVPPADRDHQHSLKQPEPPKQATYESSRDYHNEPFELMDSGPAFAAILVAAVAVILVILATVHFLVAILWN